MPATTRATIALDSERIKGATEEQLERLMECVVWCAEVADELRIHPDTIIAVCYDAEKVLTLEKAARSRVKYSADGGQWVARCDMERAEYGKYRIWWSPFGLAPKRDDCRLLDVAHELFHIRAYDYTGVAEELCGEDNVSLLQKKEETLVTALERMYGGIFDIKEV